MDKCTRNLQILRLRNAGLQVIIGFLILIIACPMCKKGKLEAMDW